MARLRFHRRGGSSSQTLLLVALGAVTGLAVGMVLADRVGGLDGLKGQVRDATCRRRRTRLDEEVDRPAGGELDSEYASTTADPSPMTADDAVPETGRASQAPRKTPPSEEELEARVLEVFNNDLRLRSRAIDIGAIGDGVVELTGWVRSAEELAYARTLARGVPDVGEVMDELTIRGADYSRVGQAPADR
jgi:osmotically-inducible protein OsmY